MLKKLRIGVQFAFFVLTVLVVIQYVHFVNTGHGRPDLIEIFCPIGGFYSLMMWLKTGFIDHFHPAGMILLLAGIISSLICMKGFCGWICPVGSFLDFLSFCRNKTVGKYLDNIKVSPKLKLYTERLLSLVKFGVAGGLIYLIVRLPGQLMPIMYQNAVLPEDVSLYKFWIDAYHGQHNLSLALVFIILLMSFLIPRFWCRYLCPLGAFYGIFNVISFMKLKRNDNCVKCKLCAKGCPVGLSPHTSKWLNNFRCIGCLKCIDSCPSKALNLSLLGSYQIKPLLYPLILLFIYGGIIALAIIGGIWHSQIPSHMYARIFLQHGIMKAWAMKMLMKNKLPPLP